jgi:hypothetical protein
MQGEQKELWVELCRQASIEQDPKKLMELVEEINRLLGRKLDRLTGSPSQDPVSGS